MANLIYGVVSVAFDDRVLAHLQVVVVTMLQRGKSFTMSWRDSGAAGHGRSAIWIDPSLPLYFRFPEPRVPEIDGEWVAALLASAESSTGLVVCGPDGETVTAEPGLFAGAAGVRLASRRARKRA